MNKKWKYIEGADQDFIEYDWYEQECLDKLEKDKQNDLNPILNKHWKVYFIPNRKYNRLHNHNVGMVDLREEKEFKLSKIEYFICDVSAPTEKQAFEMFKDLDIGEARRIESQDF